MQTLTGDLLVFEAPSVVAGFRALAAMPTDIEPLVKVIDASPLGGGRFLILLKGEACDLTAALKSMRDALIDGGQEELVDHELIENADGSLLEAAYSLLPAKLRGSLLVIETETVSAMFAAAQLFHSQKLTPLEIRIRKTGMGGAYGFFTGESEACGLAAADVRTRFKNAVREVKVESFDQPNESIRALFEGA